MAVKPTQLTPIAAFLAMTLAPTAVMAEEQEQFSTEDVEVIRVAGTRASLSEALNEKRFSDAQVDVIAAEDIGVMPDPDIGDSLERVAGVQIQRSENGEAREVNVRGLPGYFTKTLYNGRSISTPLNANRNFSYQIMPSAFISQASVQKSSSADLTEGGIAGTVDLRSHRAFMANERVVRAVVKGSYDDNSGEWGPDLSFIYSDRFADDTLGFAFGANYLQEDNYSQHTNSNPLGSKFWNDVEINDEGDTDRVYGTSAIRADLQNNERERAAVFTNLEWRPNDNFTLFGEVFYTDYSSKENRLRHNFNTALGTDLVGGDFYEHDGNIYARRMEIDNVSSFVESNPISRDADIMVNTLEATYEWGDWTVNAGYTMVRSEMLWNAVNLKSDLNERLDMTFHGDRGGPWGIEYRTPGVDLTDQSLYGDLYMASTNFGTVQESNSDAVNLDVSRYTEIVMGDFAVTNVSFGMSYTKEEMLESTAFLDLDTQQFARFMQDYGVSDPGFIMAAPGNGGWFDGANGTNYAPQNFWAPNVNGFMDSIHLDDLRAFGRDQQAQCEASGELRCKDFEEFQYDLFEDTFAAYFRANFEFGYNWSGNVGVRYVRTDTTANAYTADWTQGVTAVGRANPGVPTSNILYVFNDEVTTKTTDKTDSHFLPSLNLKYAMRDDMDVRLSLSRTMARPNKNDLTGNTFVTGDGQGDITINTSEGALDPFISNNVDISWSWFYNEDSMISAAYFFKDLETFVRLNERIEMVEVTDLDGSTRLQEVTVRSQDNEEGLHLHGLEFAYQTAFTQLPGWLSNTGMQANYTFIDNSEPELLDAASKHNANLVMYYSTTKVDLRLSHNYRAGYLKDPADGVRPATYYDDQNRTTLAASYRPAQALRLTASISNLFDNDSSIYTDGGTIRVFNDPGRKVNVGMVYSF
ncbi:TonB-dependent receptor [Ferrimonas marina]|uniref:TonB-dependent receptor n=1 Tax=Ferrimonas marina TaxID=299255 RepID=A0A1M5YC04_9GAMM|nr:TonB-dependent receptor [Ferrimonas marina]SHI09547.1 TonB-dependent receptor [Ferrimonas marina]